MWFVNSNYLFCKNLASIPIFRLYSVGICPILSIILSFRIYAYE
jgi:hypothetical protein